MARQTSLRRRVLPEELSLYCRLPYTHHGAKAAPAMDRRLLEPCSRGLSPIAAAAARFSLGSREVSLQQCLRSRGRRQLP